MRGTWIIGCLAWLVLSVPVFGVVSDQSMKIFAISEGGGAITATLDIRLVPGSGKVWSSVEPLVGTGTQESAKTALKAAAAFSPDVLQYDYFFDINSDASTVDGPSAGSAMGLLIVSSLQNKHLPANVGLTGTLSEDGQVGAVGGVFDKAKEAARIGLKLFMVPKGEGRQIVRLPDGVRSVDLAEYAFSEWGMKVVEIDRLDQALALAFSDINSLEIQSSISGPDFFPPAIRLSEPLLPMHEFTAGFLERVEIQSSRARSDLGKSAINDPVLVDAMLAALNASDHLLSEGHEQLDRNFVFTAANSVFLAQANVLLVDDLLKDPAIAQWNGISFNQKVELLELAIGRQKALLSSPLPRDSFEWIVGAQQRLSWAEEHVSAIRRSQSEIGSKGTMQQQLGLLSDYEFAVAWLSASRDFAGLGASLSQNGLGVQVGFVFDATTDKFISDARNAFSKVPAADQQSVQEKIDAAVIAKDSNFSVAAAYNAGFAHALARAAIEKQSQDVNGLRDSLFLELSNANELRRMRPSLVWGAMYADHALYYASVGDDRLAKGDLSGAREAFGSGLILAHLSKNLLDAGLAAQKALAQLPADSKISVIPPIAAPGIAPANDVFFWASAFLFIVSVMVLFFSIYTLFKGSKSQESALDNKIDYYSKLQADLSKSLSANRVGKLEYMDLYAQYETKKQALLSEKNKVSRLVLAAEDVAMQWKALDSDLRVLKREYRSGSMSVEDFERGVGKVLDHARERLKAISLPSPVSTEVLVLPPGSLALETAPPSRSTRLEKPPIETTTINNREKPKDSTAIATKRKPKK